jgi:hypothetical protein
MKVLTRGSAVAAAIIAAACTSAMDAEPDPHGAGVGFDRVRVLGEIAGYNQDDPRITVVASGRTVLVEVTTYGGGCHSKGETEVSRSGMTADVVPYDYTAPPGTVCTQPLLSFRHTAAIEFDRAGTATIRVRGVDRRTKSAQNMTGSEIVVERTVVLN